MIVTPLPVFALLALFFQTAIPDSTGPVKWESDWKTAFARAKSEQRLVFADYFANWCEPCLRMERSVFPEPAVAEVLRRFVPLKVDFDRSNAVSYGVTVLPTYVVYDPWENERLRFAGFKDADDFTRKLTVAAGATAALVDASRLLNESDSIEGHLALGRAYLQVRAPKYARDEFDRSVKLATRGRKADVAQMAETESAATWILDEQPAKAIRLLEKIAARPVDPVCGATAWLAIGHARLRLGDGAAAAEAYGRAVATAPEGSSLRRAAQSALDATVAKK